MRLWKNIISILLALVCAACAPAPDELVVRSAAITGGALSAHIDWQPDASVMAALDNGIPLDFIVRVRAQDAGTLGWHTTAASSERRVELRYYPLSRQYQWRDLDRGETRSYAARALLLAAFEDMRLPLNGFDGGGAQRYVLDISLDRTALPGALRVPALLRPAWRISSRDYAWSAPAG
jgi:hypothetical protein